MEPQGILDATRKAIKEHAGDDPDKLFYANRFVFARLQLDERKTKTKVKKHLFENNSVCHYCKEIIVKKTGIDLHRVDGNCGYSIENCVLMHPNCHKKYHSENPSGKRAGRPCGQKLAKYDMPILEKVSKRYDSGSYLYWWDISHGFSDKFDKYEGVEFVKKDTGERCYVPIPALKGYLTKDRQTSRGKGHWGIKVLKDREGELAFEPGNKSDNWLYFPVVWLNETHEN